MTVRPLGATAPPPVTVVHPARLLSVEITIQQAAPLLGRSVRAVRARIARGDLAARKVDGEWRIPLDQIPLTAEQRADMQHRAELARQAVEAALPSRAADTRDRRRRSVADLTPFANGRVLLEQVTASSLDESIKEPLARLLHGALLTLGEAAYEFDSRLRAHRFRRARRQLSRIAAMLLLIGPQALVPTTAQEWRRAIENEILPPLGGLLRWCEQHAARDRRRR